MNRWFTACGILASLIYVGTVVLGGAITPGYSHVANAISELIEAGAPHQHVLDGWFIVYNVLLALFGAGLFTGPKGSAGRRASAGAAMLVVVGVLGVILTLFFPMDPIGSAPTFAGTMHLVVSGIISPLTVLAMIFVGIGVQGVSGLTSLKRYSIASAVAVFLTGGAAALSAVSASPVMGLLERLTIGGFIQWVFVVAWRLARTKRIVEVA